MKQLSLTIIDVGWGDSIFLEYKDSQSIPRYGLIDSNDTTYNRSSFIFLKKYFEREKVDIETRKPIFDFILLSHAHTDHGEGLKAIMRYFGTKHFWYPKSLEWTSLVYLIKYCNRSSNVLHHESIDTDKILPKFGKVKMKVLWPYYDRIETDENNNSTVVVFEIGNVSFVLTGDAEEDVWNQIANEIPVNTQFFKVPHHGSVNGTFDSSGNTTWFNHCPTNAKLGISSHIRPYTHPDQEVIDLFDNSNRLYFRTDEHYHITFITDGAATKVKYSHI